ncbi:MAG: hypothetical protein CVU84_11115 [Firmicutes bacterium HGW-Firmicutes-1]|jgi:uncharacterized repeat protein (TIGR01451 family)|nr:MAG: hypothetical protein CVU84_11115 [Firmicutes bacterium HGW-Firmicutes-1]
MASPIRPCSCVPYTTLCCCGVQNGISVTQPTCQTLPDGSIVNNPAYDALVSRSYWSYKFCTDCARTTRGISNIVIPVCEILNPPHIIVDEKIDGCGEFEPVLFSLSKTDPNFATAPIGFQWLKIEVEDRFEKGVCVEYRITLTGNFPTSIQPIGVKAHGSNLIFDCDCFLVPACNPQGILFVLKDCSETITNNQATLDYVIEVNNLGNAPLANVQYLDTLTIPSGLSISTISVSPSTLDVIISPVGQIIISGNLNTINPGDQVIVTYKITLIATTAGTFMIDNMVMVSALGTEAADLCTVMLEVVQLQSSKCCSVTEEGSIVYVIQIANLGNSPDTTVNITDSIVVPPGVTVQFNDFESCLAVFGETSTPVPLNTNILGPAMIMITCPNTIIPSSSIAQKMITLTVISSAVTGTTIIANTLQEVTLVNPNEQIFLGAGNLPITALAQVTLSFGCLQPCS